MSDYKLYTNLKKYPDTEFEYSKINYNDIVFPYFPSRVSATKAIGKVTLQKFLDSHSQPSDKIMKVFRQIERAAEEGDIERKDELKQTRLFYFTPSTILNIRNYKSIKRFNPLLVAEYDKVGQKRAEKLRELVFERFKSCICAYLSPSKKGVKFLFKIPVVQTVEEYKEYFFGLAYYLDQVDGFDGANQNPTLPLFLSYDHDMLIRPAEELETWTQRGYKINEFPININLDNYEPVTDFPPHHKKWAENNIKKQIEKADQEGTGHSNVISGALLAGGYCAGGYFSEFEAWGILETAIDRSSYLQKGLKGYKKTAQEMFNKGMNAPLKFN